ncbi:glycosyltransferase family 9 protein [Citrifermentans bremense]|uniref:glycosyltransferase family 9 protein n=1 Tax=Citrifermentans bremense TaxID=60035 RepID=UPI0004272258|nr:glycosyltransferase family 9 protein [Citrifermentans bremense]
MRILLIKPGAIGDLLQLTPVLRALHRRYPQARITVLVSSRFTASLFAHNPMVYDTVIFDKRGEQRSWGGVLRLWSRLREEKYDLVLNYQRSNLKAWVLASAAFPCRVLIYHKKNAQHAVVNHLEVLRPLGIDPLACDTTLELYTGTDDKRYAEELLASLGAQKQPVIAINPGASHPVNRWSTTNFARLCDLLAGELGAKVLIIGGSEDTPLAQAILAGAGSEPVVLTGTTTLLQLGAVLQKCDLLVTGDTGPMHVSTAVGTKVLALFGAADPLRTGPVGSGHRVMQAHDVDCVPCRSRKCDNGRYLACMEGITPEEVLSAVKEMLQSGDSA